MNPGEKAAILIFALSAAGLLYILFGYPVLLAALARWRARPIRHAFTPRPVTALVAVHNGEAWMRGKLESLLALEYPPGLLDVLVISDGSDDGTDRIVREFAPRGVELIAIPRGGKAVASERGDFQGAGRDFALHRRAPAARAR